MSRHSPNLSTPTPTLAAFASTLPTRGRVNTEHVASPRANQIHFSNSQRSAARLSRRAGRAFVPSPSKQENEGVERRAAHLNCRLSVERLASLAKDAAPCGAPLRLLSDPGHAFRRRVVRAVRSASSWRGRLSTPQVEPRAARVRHACRPRGAAQRAFRPAPEVSGAHLHPVPPACSALRMPPEGAPR